jgi:hypothetical protein
MCGGADWQQKGDPGRDPYRNSDTVTCAGARRQMSVKSLINYGGGGEI